MDSSSCRLFPDLLAWTLVVLVGLRWLTGDLLPPVAIFHQLSHLLLPLVIPLLLLAGRRRRRWQAVALGAVCLAPITVYGPWFGESPPHHHPSGNRGATLSVATLNLGTSRSSGAEVAEAISHWDVDLVTLQELSQHHVRPLRRKLEKQLPHQAFYPLGIPGQAILSRHPIVHHQLLPNSGRLPVLEVALDVNGRLLTVLSIHVSVIASIGGRGDRDAFVFDMLGDRASTDQPTLLLGDLNSNPQGDGYQTVRDAGWQDAFAVAGEGPGFTFPVPMRWRGLPVPSCLRLDYILHTPHFTPRRAVVLSEDLSDHRPLLAELRWAPDPPDPAVVEWPPP